jgi:hypothetical protein
MGATPPIYGHVPMILGADGEKLSKRHGAVSVMDYPAQGYLPEAMLNYLARLGWSHGDEEIFSMEQFCAGSTSTTCRSRRPSSIPKSWPGSITITSRRPTMRLADLARPQLERGRRLQRRAAAAADCADEGARHTPWSNWPTRRCCSTASRSPSGAAGPALTDAVSRRWPTFAERCKTVAWDKAALSAMLKEVLAAHKFEDAATGDAAAPDADRPVADAGHRCRGGAVRTRNRASARAQNISNFFRKGFAECKRCCYNFASSPDGGIAQLGERLHGMQEVSGSIPLTSTNEAETA